MCFSAEASFTGSAVITAIGVATLVKTKKPEQAPLAAIPLIFGVQQCAEGVLWITLKSGGVHANLQNTATYIFLVTALIIWPTLIPVSVRLMEKGQTRRKILGGLTAAGALVSLFYLVCLLRYNVTPRIQSFHIDYTNNFPHALVTTAFVLYLTATITPLFVSSVKRMRVFGVSIAVSCLITGVVFAQYLTSVWCFFAACISIVIYWVLSGMRKTEKTTMDGQTTDQRPLDTGLPVGRLT